MATTITKEITPTTSSTTTKKSYRCPPFYLNILLLNKDELVGNKVTEKTGKGFFGKAAAFTANKLITDEKIITNLAENLIDGVSKTIRDLGITAQFDVKFKQGAFVVIRIQIDEIDTLQLILTAKGQEFANNFNALLASTAALGMEETVTQKVNDKIYSSIGDGMITKFNEMIPKKMEEKGVLVDCHACSTSEQAEIFFEMYEKLTSK